MRPHLRLWGVFAAACASLLLAAAPAAADDFTTLYNAYRQTGTINPCKFSTGQLQGALNEVPPDISQYAPDFPDALQSALAARARGACAGKGAAAPAAAPTPAPPAGGGRPGPPKPTGSAATPAPTQSQPTGSIATTVQTTRGSGASSAPAPVIALAIVMAAFALAALWWTLFSLRGRDPRWLGSARHAFAEAGYRAGVTLEEFGDWLRLGR